LENNTNGRSWLQKKFVEQKVVAVNGYLIIDANAYTISPRLESTACRQLSICYQFPASYVCAIIVFLNLYYIGTTTYCCLLEWLIRFLLYNNNIILPICSGCHGIYISYMMIDITLLSGAIIFFALVNSFISDFDVVLRYYCFYQPIYYIIHVAM